MIWSDCRLDYFFERWTHVDTILSRTHHVVECRDIPPGDVWDDIDDYIQGQLGCNRFKPRNETNEGIGQTRLTIPSDGLQPERMPWSTESI